MHDTSKIKKNVLSLNNATAVMALFLSLFVLSGCFMVARKGVGQMRETIVEMDPKPTVIVDGKTCSLIIVNNADGLSSDQRSHFIDSLSKAFHTHSIKMVEKGSTDSHLTIQFDDLDRSFIKNNWTLTGILTVVNSKQLTSTSHFTVTTHKTIGAVSDITEDLANDIVAGVTK